MKLIHLFFSLVIVGCTAIAWFVLGSALSSRTQVASAEMTAEVAGVWGPPVVQHHPTAWFDTPNAPNGRAIIQPASSAVNVDLRYSPKQRGLIWHKTYDVAFQADYVFSNPTKIPQTIYISFPLPDSTAGLNEFEYRFDKDAGSGKPMGGDGKIVTRAIVLPASQSVTLHTGYKTRGADTWSYKFPDGSRISNFRMTMKTDFHDVNYPVGTGSPSQRETTDKGWNLVWEYPDVLGAPSIGMDMPKLVNAGPVAARIAFFAPVSLLLFVVVVLLIAGLKGLHLHPMHVFFVSAGFFAFHLLFAYLVDLIALYPSFAIASVVSVLLVCGYLKAVGGNGLLRIAFPAQVIYLVLFSLSFFFDGLTGITLTVCAVVTLALLMFLTAKVDWRTFDRKTSDV
jgi:hypothetical protein